MKNIYIILVVSILIILTGITIYILNEDKKSKEMFEINFNIKDLINNLIRDENINNDINIDSMQNITNQDINNVYNIDNNMLDEFQGYISITSLTADEILIVKVKDIENIEIIKEKLKKRAESIAENFENYLPAQHSLAKNPLIYSKGKYVIFSISDNNSKIKTIFEEEFRN